MVWIRTMRGIITDPLQTFTAIAAEQSWRGGIVYYLVSGLIAWAVRLLRTEPPRSLSGRTNPLTSSPWFDITTTLLGPLLVLIFAAFLYWAGRRQGGQGPLSRLFTTELFSATTVNLLSAPIFLAIYLIARANGGTDPLGDPVSFLINVLSIRLTYFSLRASMVLGGREAINALLLLFGVFFAVIIGFVCVIVGIIFAIGR
jgi:hypothetical protein